MSHYKDGATRRKIPECPKCGKVAVESATKYGLRNSCCGLWSWDRYPLVDKETHAARKKAHETFDVLWRCGIIKSRGEAYRLLAKELGISPEDCHIKHLSKDFLFRIPNAVEAIKEKIRNTI